MRVVGQRLVDLPEELLALLPLAGIGRDDFLELVDDQHAVGVVGVGRMGGQVVGQALRGQFGEGCLTVVDVAQHVEGIDVGDLFQGNAVGQLAAGAGAAEDGEALVTQAREQAGIEQRTLARARRRVKEHQPLRQHERQ